MIPAPWLQRALALFALAALAGCGGSAGTKNVHAARQGATAVGGTFESIAADHDSGIRQARNVVIRDREAMREIWEEHNRGRTIAAPMPEVDFGARMVVGVFMGEQVNGCFTARIVKTERASGRTRISYEAQARPTPCEQGASTPAAMATVERSADHADFVRILASPVGIESVHSSTSSATLVPAFEIARDERAWEALWARHKPGEPRPYVDFSRHTVVASFLGEKPNGCYSILMHSAYSESGKVTIRRTLTVPGPGTACSMAITAPAHIAKIDRSDGAIEIATETVTL